MATAIALGGTNEECRETGPLLALIVGDALLFACLFVWAFIFFCLQPTILESHFRMMSVGTGLTAIDECFEGFQNIRSEACEKGENCELL